MGMISALAAGQSFHIGFVFGIGIFGLLGFYMLRIFLWNTYGHEIITFNGNTFTYEADYGWFKDGKPPVEINPIVFSHKQIGYESEQIGVLVIGNSGSGIECVSQLPLKELEELISALRSTVSSSGA
jgi:hypothetical protein